MDRIIKKKIMR